MMDKLNLEELKKIVGAENVLRKRKNSIVILMMQPPAILICQMPSLFQKMLTRYPQS